MNIEAVFKWNVINQRLNDSVLPYPIRWNGSAKKWETEERIEILKKFWLRFSLMRIFSVPLITFIIWQGIVHPGSYSIHLILIQIQMLFYVFIISFLELVILHRQVEVIEAINTVYFMQVKEGFLRSSRRHIVSIDRLCQLVVIPFTLAGNAFAFLLTMVNMDQYFLIMVHTNREIASSIFFKLFRTVAVILGANVLLAGGRTCIIILFTIGLYVTKIIEMISQQCFSIQNLHLYMGIVVKLNAIKYFLQELIGPLLFLAFLTLVIGSGAVLHGIYAKSLVLFATASAMTFAMLTVLLAGFHIGCTTTGNSDKILRTWRMRAALGRKGDGKYLERVVMALPRLRIPAGDFGFLDREIKIHYFGGVLIYVANLLMATNAFN